MAVPSSSHQSPKSEVSSRKQKDESKNQKKEGDGGGNGLKDAKRNNDPGVRVVGGRIYCPFNGKTCHQVKFKLARSNRARTVLFSLGSVIVLRGRGRILVFHSFILLSLAFRILEFGLLKGR